MPKRPKVLYLYAGKRAAFYRDWERGLVPDTQLLGLNHMDSLGVDATFLELPLAEWLRRVNFNLVHLPYLHYLRRYDIVFICAGLPLVYAAKHILGWKRPRFVAYNTSFVHLLTRNREGIAGHVTRTAVHALDHIVNTASAQHRFMLKYGIDPTRMSMQTIGIDPKPFGAHDDVTPDLENPYIVSVGRDLGRDFPTLVEATRNLPPYHGKPVRLVIATKPEAIAGIVPPPHVEFRFHVPYAEMPLLYRRALFAVTPLRDYDDPRGSDTSGQYGFLEPMAAGRAVIVSDKETVRDYLQNNENALLVPPNNPNALCIAMTQLLSDEALRERLGAAGRTSVLERFTSRRFAEHLAEIFKNLAEK